MRDAIIPQTRRRGSTRRWMPWWMRAGHQRIHPAHGQAGRGKSVAADQYHYQRGGAYVRVWGRLDAGGVPPARAFEVRGKNGDLPRLNADRCKQAIMELLERDRKPIFVDEADRLAIGRIEDLRDILEMTGAPIILDRRRRHFSGFVRTPPRVEPRGL